MLRSLYIGALVFESEVVSSVSEEFGRRGVDGVLDFADVVALFDGLLQEIEGLLESRDTRGKAALIAYPDSLFPVKCQ